MMDVFDLNPREYMVIDMDTGTVLGTNVCLVPVPKDDELYDEILMSDSAAFVYAVDNRIDLCVELEG